jgi:hypothetical protein
MDITNQTILNPGRRNYQVIPMEIHTSKHYRKDINNKSLRKDLRVDSQGNTLPANARGKAYQLIPEEGFPS